MLKWFRKYNKLILAIGGSILMVTFLITGPMMQFFSPDPAKQVIGTIGEHEVTLGDQNLAGRELSILRGLSPVISQLTPASAMQWVLMKHEARQMGISASLQEAYDVTTAMSIDEAGLASRAREFGIDTDQLINVVRQWVAVQTYKELLMGSTHESVISRMVELDSMIRQFQQASSQQGYLRQYYMMMYMQQLDRIMVGSPRVSPPLVERFISDQQATVKIALVQVPAERYLDKVPQPSEAELKAHYEKYKAKLPGESQPYGFGYRFRPRVKLEYLSVPIAQLRKTVRIPESEAISYYNTNSNEFEIPAPTPAASQPAASQPAEPTVKPYDEVRSQIMDRLRDEKAKEICDRIIKQAQSILIDNARELPQTPEGYRDIPGDWQPIALEDVAQQIQQQFDILPTVVQKDKWLDLEGLQELDGIGASSIAGQANFGFVAYVLSTRELEPDEDSPLYMERLQTKMPSKPLSTFDGSQYLFRLAAAEPEREPITFEEVLHAVSQDYKQLKAFELAKADIGTWRDRLGKDSLLIVAQELGTTISEPPPFPQRDMSYARVETPNVEPVGQDEAFVADVFNLAERVVSKNPGAAVEGISPDKRSDVFPVESSMSLAVVRIDAYRPIKLSDYQRFANMPYVQSWIQQAMLTSNNDGESIDPFSQEALEQRLGFISEGGSDEEEDEAS